jgi:flavin-dependent dehydrogenase
MKDRYDVVIVGARVAGAATALLLARAGARVLLVDREPLERDPVSTHALMRTAVMQLARWNVLDRVIAAGTPAIHSASYHYGGEESRFEIAPRNGVDALYAPRRTVLDPILVEAAWEAGAELRYGARVRDVIRGDDGRVRGVVVHDETRQPQEIRADLVVGADGLGSAVARLVGAEVREIGTYATMTIYGHIPGVRDDGYHWHFRSGISVGVIPTNENSACVFAVMPADRYQKTRANIDASYLRALREGAPAVAQEVEQLAPVTLRTFAGRPNMVRRPWGPGWALVGDAGLYRDPISALGISNALRDAELLATAVGAGTPAGFSDYEATRDALSREQLDLTDRIASFAWDLGEIRQLHRVLSKAINRECDHLTQRDDVRAAS